MTPSEQHRIGSLFVATLAMLPAKFWTDDPRAFARAAKGR